MCLFRTSPPPIRPILLHTHHGNYIAEKGSGKQFQWMGVDRIYQHGFFLEKDLADPVQITKDVERSLYYYPQGKLEGVFFRGQKKKVN